jgi:hypothetical protein
MTSSGFCSWSRALVLACGALALTTTGCQLQSNMAGQTLPSAYYLRDDVQYFPAGPETRLPNLRRALEEYRLNRQAAQEGLTTPVP